jgi:hypothetical protein
MVNSMALSDTPTPRDSNGAFLEMPREEELKTVEDYEQATAYVEQKGKQKYAELILLNERTSQKIADLEKEYASIKKHARKLLPIIVDLAVMDRSFTLQPNRLQFVVCTLPSDDLCLVKLQSQSHLVHSQSQSQFQSYIDELKSYEKLLDQPESNPEYPNDEISELIRYVKEYKSEVNMDTLPEDYKHLSKDEVEAILRQDDFYEYSIEKVFAKAQKKLENVDIHNLSPNELDDLMVLFCSPRSC